MSFLPLSGLGQIAADYDAIFCDIWGVIHNGRRPHFEACGALERFRDGHGPVVLMSNTSRPAIAVPESFYSINMPDGFYDAIVTSGDAILNELAALSPGPANLLGADDEELSLLEHVPMHYADLDGAEFLIAAGIFRDEADVRSHWSALDEAADRGLTMVCTNPDVRVKVDGRVLLGPGALAQGYEQLGGKVVYGGKPHKPIYKLGRAWLEETLGYVPERILMIGDNLFTDVMGAQNEGLDCLFIQDGLYGDTEEKFREICERNGIAADYQMGALAW